MPVMAFMSKSRFYRGTAYWKREQPCTTITAKLLPSYYPKAGAFHVFALWTVRLLLIILATPVEALAQYVGDLNPHPYSSNGVGNPFSPGGPYSLSPPAVPGQGPAAPTSPYTWSNVSPRPIGPAILNRSELFGFPPSPPVPAVTSPSKGPYGITLPGNHPLAIERR